MLSPLVHHARTWFNFGPTTDILKTKNGFTLEMELPGVKKEDVTIDFEQGTLDVKAVKKDNKLEGVERTYSEREFGTISRSFDLPRNCDTEKISATLSDGVLSIVIPKSETSKIDVKIQ